MPLAEVERRTMWMNVWHRDMFGRNDFLGEVMLPMAGQIFDEPSPKWYGLQDRVSTLLRIVIRVRFPIFPGRNGKWCPMFISSP